MNEFVKSYHLVMIGRVQGVGFRYFAQQKALELKLVGWIKNKMDGSVEMEIEGPEPVADSFIDYLKVGNGYSRVDRVFKTELPELHNYTTFFIKHGR